MPGLREVRDALLHFHAEHFINNEDISILNDDLKILFLRSSTGSDDFKVRGFPCDACADTKKSPNGGGVELESRLA